MSDTLYTLSASSLEGVSATARKGAQQIQSEIETMDRSVRSSLANWTGEARAQYEAAYQSCRAAAATLPTLLDSTATTVQRVNEGYGAAETTVVKYFS